MTEINEPRPGTFCWPELATSDRQSAKQFYTKLFGWTAHDTAAGPGITYTMLRLRGLDVAALYVQDKREVEHGVPPHWNTYVSVVSADDTARHAGGLGGNVLAGPFDVMDLGRMAILQDPTGATLHAWQPRRHIGARIVDEDGAMCWSELATTDPKKAARFYSQLFGWTLKESDEYIEFHREGQGIGGTMAIGPDWGPVPPHWLIYFGVPDCDETVKLAREMKAHVRVGPKDIPNVGRFAVLVDPQGAQFAIIRMDAR